MRVPWWLKAGSLVRARAIIDKNFVPFIDNPGGFDKLPEHYKKAYMEARTRTPLPVHYQPVEVPYEYDPEHGGIVRIEDTHPIEPYFPPEADYGLWGGEGFIRGYTMPEKSKGFRPKNCKWWWPKLSQVTLYSEILNKYMLTIVTRRTLDLIDEAKGFDQYILKTHQVDLASRLGMRLKREMLVALAKGHLYPEDPEKTKSLLEKYKDYVVPLEIAEWTGLTLAQAERKYNREQQRQPVPLKHIFREQLLLELHREYSELSMISMGEYRTQLYDIFTLFQDTENPARAYQRSHGLQDLIPLIEQNRRLTHESSSKTCCITLESSFSG